MGGRHWRDERVRSRRIGFPRLSGTLALSPLLSATDDHRVYADERRLWVTSKGTGGGCVRPCRGAGTDERGAGRVAAVRHLRPSPLLLSSSAAGGVVAVVAVAAAAAAVVVVERRHLQQELQTW